MINLKRARRVMSHMSGNSSPSTSIGTDDRSEMSEDEEPSRPSSSASDLGGGGAAAKSRICSTVSGGGGGGGDHCFVPSYSDQVLENVLENVLCFLSDRRDRNAASLVCKSWYRAEAMTRSEVFIGNCYAVSPRRVTRRFGRVTSMSVKGKPRFADFGLLPPDWGARFSPWVAAMADAYRALEKLYLKRLNVSNDDLMMLARSFPNFKELVLVCCEELGTSGLATVASGCRSVVFL